MMGRHTADQAKLFYEFHLEDRVPTQGSRASEQRKGSRATCGWLNRTAQAAEQTMKPLQGISFHAGTKHAVAYYRHENGRCKLVLTVAEEPKGDVANFEATRFEAAIAAGKLTRYKLAEGKSLQFACQAEAKAMNVRTLETVAGN